MSLNAKLWEDELRHGHLRLQSAPDRPAQIDVDGVQFTSRFDAVISRAHGRAVGYLANSVPAVPQESPVQSDNSALLNHPLVPALHMANYLQTHHRGGWLFMPVPDAVYQHTQLWPPLPQELFASDKFAPGDIVLVLSVDAGPVSALRDFVRYHQELGFLVALTDFGRQHADVGTVLQTGPNMVLLPTPRLHCLGASGALPRLLPPLCKLLHEAGVMVALTGLEDSDQLQIALQSGADLLSGTACDHLDALTPPAESSPAQDALADTLRVALTRILDGETFESACEPLLGAPRVLRCYLLDPGGTQLSENLAPVGVRLDARYWPLANALGACWAHRDYFKLALGHPGQVMQTQEYLSLPDGGHCQTLAIADGGLDRQLVLCCDVRPE